MDHKLSDNDKKKILKKAKGQLSSTYRHSKSNKPHLRKFIQKWWELRKDRTVQEALDRGCAKAHKKIDKGVETGAFKADQLEQQLDSGTREFFNSTKYVQVDPARRVVRLSEILDFYPEDFVNNWHAASLIEYVNRYRRQPIPEDFQVAFDSYDWTVAKQ